MKTKYMIGKNIDIHIINNKELDILMNFQKEIIDNMSNKEWFVPLTEEVFKMFGSEFFKEFIHDDYTGMRIYLVSDIKSEDFSKNGEALRYYDKYAIIANSVDYKRTLCHEIMHSIEDAVSAKNKTMFKNWSSYNPKGYKYKVNYDQYASSYQYSITYGKGDIYFVDNYSQTNELEDRARIFKNVCMSTTEDIKKYPLLLKKAEYEEEIKKFYPMLKESIVDFLFLLW